MINRDDYLQRLINRIGNDSKFLSSDVITEFRGRGDEIHVWPLSFKEFYNYINKDFDSAIYEYMIYGGLPRVVLANSEEEKINYLENQIKKNIFKRHYRKV